MATLQIWVTGYIYIFITTVKPTKYKKIVLNTPVHSVVHTYHPDTSEASVI